MPRHPPASRLLLVVAVLAAAFAVPAASAASAAPIAGAAAVGAGRTEPTDADLRVVSYNLLHGTFCDDDAHCRASDRVDLFLRQVEAAGCPQVIGLQEVSDELRPMLVDRVPDVCDGRYDVVFDDTRGNDTELVLTALPARRARVLSLPGGLRRASRVVLDSDLGPVVLVVTHQDGDKPFPACRDDLPRYRCPAPCPEGTTYSECQTLLGLDLAERGRPTRAIRVYMGDFNFGSGAARYERILGRGYTDTHLAAGNPECDPASGTECTAGRDDSTLAALQDPTAGQRERIDLIFVAAPRGCTPGFDPSADADGDGTGTGLFAARPAVDGPGGLVWPSDHTAVSMDMTCT